MLCRWAMHLHRSNRTERLVDALLGVVSRPAQGADPMTAECVVVQSRGMERWLSMELAQRLGVWANAEFPFPRTLLERVCDAVLGPVESAAGAGGSGAEPRRLGWAVAAVLPGLLGRPEFEPLQRYLKDDPGGSRRLSLASRIARLFDDYGVYRQDLVLRWLQGRDQDWQAQLFRAASERLGDAHFAVRLRACIEALAQGASSGLPPRVCVFGLSTLPPAFLEAFAALSARVELHLFLLSPSREYWADIRSRRELLRGGHEEIDAALLHLSEGNSLLASLGRQGRDFQMLLERDIGYQETELDLYEDPAPEPARASALQVLQSDLLHLRDRGAERSADVALPLADADHSIGIHACHGPMREVEVLHDQLCALLEDTTLQPRDIIVMTPDIGRYAPVVEAVFGSSGRPNIPFRVADRSVLAIHAGLDGFRSLLQVLQGRFAASEVLDLLSSEPIRERFQIQARELDVVRTWVADSGIRWGVDAAQRIAEGQPGVEQNTWRFGLRRLLVGYAMEGDGRSLYRGTLPYADIGGAAADLLGRLCEFCEMLFEFRARLAQPQPIDALCETLQELVGRSLSTAGAFAQEQQLLREALGQLRQDALRVGFEGQVSLRALIPRLEDALQQRPRAPQGFLSAGVTFCQLLPMRSIPAQVVCLLGLNDGQFPELDTSLEFDRMRERPRPGDRSSRDDGRYLFLEALLSARRAFIVTYDGQSIHDNETIPPSVVVSDLLETMGRSFRCGRPIEDRLVVRHRLQAFSPRYFDRSDPRLFSYAVGPCAGAKVLSEPKSEPRFLSGAVGPVPERVELSLGQLERYLTRPIRTFLQDRLGLYLGDDVEPLADREPAALDNLERWKLGTELLDFASRGVPSTELYTSMRAKGVLPPGTVGELEYAEVTPSVDEVSRTAAELAGGSELSPLPLALELEGVQVTGVLRGLFPGAHLCTGFSRIGRRFELVHWIRHLLLSAVVEQHGHIGLPQRSVVVARAKQGVAVVELQPVADPQALLRPLLQRVRQAHVACLPLLEGAGRAYAQERFGRERSREHALDAARKEFLSEFGEAQDPYVRQVFGGFDEVLSVAAPASFESLAQELYAPYFAHRRVR